MRYFLITVLSFFFSTILFASSNEAGLLSETNIANSKNIALKFTEQELTWIKENPQVTLIGDPAWFPFEGFDKSKRYVGIVAEVLNLITRKSGLIFNVSETATWQHTIQFSTEQPVDIISASRANLILNKNYRPTYSTIKNPIVMIARGDMHYIPDLNSVKNLSIAVISDTGYSHIIRQTYPNVTFIKVDSINDALLGVANEQYDIVLMSMSVASYQMAELGLYELRIVGITDLDMELTLFVNRDKPILWDIINKVKLHETKQERHEILAKWIKHKYIDRYSPEKMRVLMLVTIFFIGFVFYRNHLLKKQAKVLTELAQTDKLTNIHNRLYLDKILLQTTAQSLRYKKTFSLIMIDIDYFKVVNDKYGHLVGDEMLVQFSLLITDNVRNSDVIGRWGGEEFLIICPETNLQEASILAEKLREQVQQTIFLNIGRKTASFGVCEYQASESVELCLGRADKALFVAKRAGRNQVKAEG
ncbi:transporter substrate-binding domain-containing diguanylate cyclase [Psychromonas hadalis]|uniref:transporter substrate-binding domain-containing diguanylate cyclase n=1 Tax=Psychromonas hadalis TaxID=211669 RepID=UPI0003B50D92|nr:GGDEF domain-containing protein [Psychromonas hadalis]